MANNYLENDENSRQEEPVRRKRQSGRRRIHPSTRADVMEKMPMRIRIWRTIRPLLALVVAFAIVVTVCVFGVRYAVDNYFMPVVDESNRTVVVEIERGSSVTAIAEMLEQKGIINSAFTFKYYVDFVDMTSKMKAGTYELSPDMSYDDIIDIIKENHVERTIIKITLTEGQTVEELAEKLAENGLFGGKTDTFLRLAKSGAAFENYQFIKNVIEENDKSSEKRKYVLEGYLFADTYEFYSDASEQSVINKLLARFNEIYEVDYIKRSESLGMSMDEVVTLASLIEEEAKTADFEKVSAVFHNRIKTGMKLQSDAAIQYLTNDKKLIFTDEDMASTSKYNTHIYEGLPLGPISQPSKAAINAALYPDEQMIADEYLYFCLADPATGELVFAKTLEEHEENVEKYRPLWEEYDRKKN